MYDLLIKKTRDLLMRNTDDIQILTGVPGKVEDEKAYVEKVSKVTDEKISKMMSLLKHVNGK